MKAKVIKRLCMFASCAAFIFCLASCGGGRSSVKAAGPGEAGLRKKISSLERRIAEMEKRTKELEGRRRTVPIFIGGSDAGKEQDVVVLKEKTRLPVRRGVAGEDGADKSVESKGDAGEPGDAEGPEETGVVTIPVAAGAEETRSAEEEAPVLAEAADTGEAPGRESGGPVEQAGEAEEEPAWSGTPEAAADEPVEAGEPRGKEDRLEEWRREVHFQSGVVHQSQLKQAAALAEYRKALVVNPENAYAHYNIGTIYEAQGKDVLAERSYGSATKFYPGYAEAFLNLGVLHHKRGKYKEAVENYRQSVSVDGGLGRAYVGLADIYEKHLSKPEQALIYYRKYMESCDDLGAEELVAERISRLEKSLRSRKAPKKKRKATAQKAKKEKQKKVKKKKQQPRQKKAEEPGQIKEKKKEEDSKKKQKEKKKEKLPTSC